MIILTTRRTFNLISWLFRWFMGTPYSHCAFIIELYGTEVVIEASLMGGVKMVSADNFFIHNKIVKTYAVKEGKGDQLLKYSLEQLGDDYSLLSLLGIVSGIATVGKDGHNSFICSELIARGLGLEHHNLDHITVEELDRLLAMEASNAEA